MAKNFPYFKFTVTEWLTGDIVYEDYDVQGLFINICAIYWQRDGKLSLQDINLRYKNPSQLAKLTDRFISVTDGFISVNFLDEQLIDAGHISKINSENGKKGGRPKALSILQKKPTANRPLSELKAKKSKEEKEEERNIFIVPTQIEVENYFLENNYRKDAGAKAWKYYNESNWKDSKGHKVKNWKQKMQGVWFKEENEIKVQKYSPLQGTL